MSNALVVNASHSASGHPIAVFGPQLSYHAPQILSELDLHSPDYAAEGASFPGTGIVELGRGADYAWSATSAGSDLIDQRLEKVCNPSGGAPAAQRHVLLLRRQVRADDRGALRRDGAAQAGGLGAPTRLDHAIFKTRHGIVQGWTTVHGTPVAIATQRSTYGHDVDSVVGFLGWGRPSVTHDVTSWTASAAKIGFTFNRFYVHDRDTGYFVSGLDPLRPSNVDPALPTWGTGGPEWTGDLPAAQHVQQVDPRQGFFVSWNNKPAPGFAAADDQYGYGQVCRSVLLVNQLRGALAEAHACRVVQAMGTAATRDLDGARATAPGRTARLSESGSLRAAARVPW